MTKFTQMMRDAAEDTPVFVMATADKNGKPNGVPMGCARIISDDEIMIADNFMHKTRKNIEENPIVAVSFWSHKLHGGYQVKGKARIESDGKEYDKTIEWMKSKNNNLRVTPKAIVIVKVDEIYEIGFMKDSSKNLAE